MPPTRLHLRWNCFSTGDTITLAGHEYTLKRPGHILDWAEFMDGIFAHWKLRGFQVKSIFYPSRSLYSITISK